MYGSMFNHSWKIVCAIALKDGVNQTNQHKPINKPFYKSLKKHVPPQTYPIKPNSTLLIMYTHFAFKEMENNFFSGCL